MIFQWFWHNRKNADAMVLASARLRRIHPPDNIQNGGHPGGMPFKCALARTMVSAFWWWIMAWQRLLESTFCVPYSVTTVNFCTYVSLQNNKNGRENVCQNNRSKYGKWKVFTIQKQLKLQGGDFHRFFLKFKHL
jgi:hypothetical protein